MKRILFIFMLMVLVGPLQIQAETTNSESAGGYTQSSYNGITTFKFGDGHYFSYPAKIIITSRDFNLFDVMETDIPLSSFKITNPFDLEKDNNVGGNIKIVYKDVEIEKFVNIFISDYIEIEDEIIVTTNEFDIWNHIKTNVSKEDIEIVGEYDLESNGKYSLLIKYKDILKETMVVVDIEENKEVFESVCPSIDTSTKEEVLTYETKNYINNYYTYNTENKEVRECTCNPIELPTPINKTIYNNNPTNDLFYYVSYVFYGLVIILLSISVVRKK